MERYNPTLNYVFQKRDESTNVCGLLFFNRTIIPISRHKNENNTK